jgi:hypothetical protein
MFMFRLPSRPRLDRIKQTALIYTGFAVIAAGVVVAPLPGPLGLPVMVLGGAIVLRNSRHSRRLFVRLHRRYPQTLRPVNKLVRRRRRPATSAP